MLEKPDLEDQAIITCLQAHYGVMVLTLEFLPIGNDASAWVYRVRAADGQTWFLKVRKGTVYESALTIPRYLRDQGLRQVVAPIPAHNGKLWIAVENFALILYPYIDGVTGMEKGMSEAQWREFGTVLKQIHSLQLPAELLNQVQRENFVPKWSAAAREIDALINAGNYDQGSAVKSELAAFWLSRQAEILRIIERCEELGQQLQTIAPKLILCHADIHTANILIDQQGKLFIVDWDQPILAPVERDLMFAPGNGSREATLFFEGYDVTTIDPLALAYYCYEWVVQEIGDYGERVFLMSDTGEATLQDSVRGFKQLFDPGDVVEGAYQTEIGLS
ncbi:MAG: aminoglycoside phosphotransferase family protein [Anaerolineae bacterium]|nr:aminoglycoside phosphotransferase family protein [Anaerolineae bacterium]